MNMETMTAIFEDQAFVESLLAMESVAEVQTALKEKGVEMTEADILAVRDLLTKVESGEMTLEQLKQIEEGELSEDALEQVAGGLAFTLIGTSILVCKVVSIISGAIAGAGAVVGGYYGVRSAVENRW